MLRQLDDLTRDEVTTLKMFCCSVPKRMQRERRLPRLDEVVQLLVRESVGLCLLPEALVDPLVAADWNPLALLPPAPRIRPTTGLPALAAPGRR